MSYESLRPRSKKGETEGVRTPWTQEETDALHEMVREYMWAKTFRKKARWLIPWLLGVPGAILAFWEPLERLWKLISWKVK